MTGSSPLCSSPARPPRPSEPCWDNLPAILKQGSHWVLWRYSLIDGKWTKPPHQIGGALATVSVPGTWASFEQIRQAYQFDIFDGVGYVFTGDDGVVGFDWDHSVDGAEIDPTAADHISRLNTYTEVSPSGHGLRAFAPGKLPPGGRKQGRIEMYDRSRYLTLTGNLFPGTPNEIQPRQEVIDEIHGEVFAERLARKAETAARLHVVQPMDLDDIALLTKARAASNGSKFSDLYRGDWKPYFKSQSEGDLWLCSQLAFWTGREAARIDRLFRASPLCRPKWDRDDYRENTIAAALRNCDRVYEKQSHTMSENAAGAQGVKICELRSIITGIMLEEKTKEFIRRRKVVISVQRHFEREGYFLRTADNRLFYFYKHERRLYDLDSSAFDYLTSDFTGLGKTESVYSFTLHSLKTIAARTEAVEVHTFAYFDPVTGFLAVSDAGTGVWIRERNGKWTFQYNGDNDLLFLTEQDAEAFEPDFTASGENLSWFLDQFLLADHDPLSIEDQKTLLLVELLHEFFPALRLTRMILAFLGAMGSGKTSGVKLIGRWKVGPRFQVSGLRKDKEDAFIAAVCNRTIVGFDNADSRLPWLEDALAVYATGQRYRLRRLYTTNDEVAYDPRASISITSRDPHFNRPDVAERLLPLHFERPAEYRPEPALFAELTTRRNGIWGEVFTRLGAIADSISEQKAPPLKFRMADFATFGWALFAQKGKADDWVALLARLERAQAGFAAENDGLIEALRILLERDGRIENLTTGDLFKKCLEIAKAEGLSFPVTAQGFGRRLIATKRTIELELRCRFTAGSGHGGQRRVTLVPRSKEGGGER